MSDVTDLDTERGAYYTICTRPDGYVVLTWYQDGIWHNRVTMPLDYARDFFRDGHRATRPRRWWRRG